jgi:superfamily II DNA/RNA helicase
MTYVHRIGRTARAGKSGVSVTLIDWDDLPKWKLICDTLDLPFHQPAETYSTSEHLYLELDIPHEAKSVLPRAARTRAGLEAEQIEDLGGPDHKRSGRRTAESGGGRGGRSRGGDRQRTGSEAGQRPSNGECRGDGERAERPTGETGASKRNRRRRRTRGGSPVSGAADAQGTATTPGQPPASQPTAG